MAHLWCARVHHFTLYLCFSFHLKAAALAGVVPIAVSLSWSARVPVSGEEEQEGRGWMKEK